MFFVDIPQKTEDVEPYRVGDKKFWNKSNCNWQEQVDLWNRLPQNNKDEWETHLDERWRQDQQEEELESDGRQVTNSDNLAGEEIREMKRQEYREQHNMMTSHQADARKTVSELFIYKQGPKPEDFSRPRFNDA